MPAAFAEVFPGLFPVTPEPWGAAMGCCFLMSKQKSSFGKGLNYLELLEIRLIADLSYISFSVLINKYLQ